MKTLTIMVIFFKGKSKLFQKIFEGKLFIRTISTTLLQIFSEFSLSPGTNMLTHLNSERQKTGLSILEIFHLQKPFLENI